MAAEIIIPRHEFKYSGEQYPEYEWYWRGIVDRRIWDPGWTPPGGIGTNTCLTDIGVFVQAGDDVIGFHKGHNIGAAEPTTSPGGVEFYGFVWDYPATIGQFEIRWGASGLAQLENVNELLLKAADGSDAGTAIWDQTEKAYLLINQPMAGQLNGMYDNQQIPPFCFNMDILPVGPLISYSYTNLERTT